MPFVFLHFVLCNVDIPNHLSPAECATLCPWCKRPSKWRSRARLALSLSSFPSTRCTLTRLWLRRLCPRWWMNCVKVCGDVCYELASSSFSITTLHPFPLVIEEVVPKVMDELCVYGDVRWCFMWLVFIEFPIDTLYPCPVPKVIDESRVLLRCAVMFCVTCIRRVSHRHAVSLPCAQGDRWIACFIKLCGDVLCDLYSSSFSRRLRQILCVLVWTWMWCAVVCVCVCVCVYVCGYECGCKYECVVLCFFFFFCVLVWFVFSAYCSTLAIIEFPSMHRKLTSCTVQCVVWCSIYMCVCVCVCMCVCVCLILACSISWFIEVHFIFA